MIEVNRQAPDASDPRAQQGNGRAAVPDGAGPRTESNRGDSMTQRDRPSCDGAGAQPARGHSPLPAPLSPVPFVARTESYWEAWYAQASAEQRQQVIDLAREQGVLCSAQLPHAEAAPRRSVLTDLLASSPPPLEPLDAEPL